MINKVNDLKSEISEAFIAENLPLVKSVVNSFLKRKKSNSIDKNELISWGIEGLLKAKKKYVYSEKSNFKTYAYYRIKGQIYDNLRSEWKQRNPVDYANHKLMIKEQIKEVTKRYVNDKSPQKRTSYESALKEIVIQSSMAYMLTNYEDHEVPCNSKDAGDPEQTYLDKENDVVNIALHKLDRLEKDVIEMIYFNDMKQNIVAEKLHLSKSKISRIHSKALNRLKFFLEKSVIKQ